MLRIKIKECNQELERGKYIDSPSCKIGRSKNEEHESG